MLTLKKLIAATPPEVRIRSQVCASKLNTAKQNPRKKKGEENLIEHLYTVVCLDGPRKATIRYYDGYPSHVSPVWVSCDCPYWLYYCEYAVHKHKSTDIIYCNGQPPVIRNPRQIPYLCKHLFNLTKYIRAAGQKQAMAPSSDLSGKFLDTCKDILLLLHHASLSQEQIEKELLDSLLMHDVEPVLKAMTLAKYIKQAGSEFKITEEGLLWLAEHL